MERQDEGTGVLRKGITGCHTETLESVDHCCGAGRNFVWHPGGVQYQKAMEDVTPPIETEAQLLEVLTEAQRTSVETTLLNEEALQV